VSNRLDITTSDVLAELRGAQGLACRQPDAEQTGWTAGGACVQGQLEAAGQRETLEAYVALEGSRILVVALVGSRSAEASANATWETIVSTFRFVGARPTPPQRATVGLPAPSFTLLDRVKGPAVVNFFATWCVDCRADTPIIARRWLWTEAASRWSASTAAATTSRKSRHY